MDDEVLSNFQKSLAWVQKDVLQANTLAKEIGLCFEAHLMLGPLPMGHNTLNISKSREQLFGFAPYAPHSFVVKGFFEYTSKEGSSGTSSRVELLSTSSQVFADVSMSMITAYGDITSIGRDLLLKDNQQIIQGLSRAQSFYGAVFKGLDADGNGSIDYQELKHGLARMEIYVPDAELQAHFLAHGTAELDVTSVKRLLKR
jgi:hypothetical protein